MMALSMKTYLALLWGISVLYAVESDMSASNTETSSMSSTAEPHKPAEISVASTAETAEEATATYRGDSANNTTSDLVTMPTVAATTSRTEPRLLHASTAVITTAGAAHPSHSAMILETTANPTGDQIHQQTPTTSTAMAAPATASAAASVATVAVSSQQPSSTAKPEVTSKLSPITSPETFPAPVFNQTFSGTSASATTTMTASRTSEAALVFDPTTSETFTTSTALLSTSKLVSVTKTPNSTSQFPDTAGLSSTAESPTISFSTESPISNIKASTPNVSTAKVSTPSVSTAKVSTAKVSTPSVSTPSVSTAKVSTAKVSTPSVSTPNVSTTNVSPTNVSTTNVSTSPIGILIPRAPKKLPVPTTKSTPVTTTAPCEVSKSPSSYEVQPCSTRRLVKHCLIAVASLAALATVFMISTIILCIKLSTRKYKVKKTQPATEMMCISALLPERNISYSRQRNPVTNGVLVIHGDADSDEDGGDNLTLSSFLPENDRYV
ncbi:P-selectin glycoprotein ligand 1 [Anarhichas minor]|uniref:P-selectin glycoprotein ligand 1 n=1 Tax=Anarhichas minor TaxID=65739 RepID=UPI003F7329EC